ncbi:MAG: hypothetical protein WDN31_11315 [Hyphomicrobium sp.]
MLLHHDRQQLPLLVEIGELHAEADDALARLAGEAQADAADAGAVVTTNDSCVAEDGAKRIE